MATAVEEAIDVAADAAEAVAEESTQVAEAMREWSGRDVGLGVFFGLGVGVTAGVFSAYFLMSKRLQTKYEAIADEEIAGMKAHYDSKIRALDNREEKKTLDQVAQELKYATDGKDGGGRVPYHLVGSEPDKSQALREDMEQEAADEADPNVVVNIFNNNVEDPEIEMEEGWNYEEEVKTRTMEVPYVIHRDEHHEGPPGNEEYEKYTLTYFEGDDVLCKEDDSVITDQDEVVGLGNLSRFGHGSGDPDIVYIRNDKLKVDLEVVHSDGKYAMQVQGFQEDELQHSSSMKRRLPRRSEYDADN